MTNQVQTQVLIIGAGPAGLVSAIVLARNGIRSILVERHAGTSIFPRATGISTRSMELFRTWGLEEKIRSAGFEAEIAFSIRPTLVAPPITTFPLGFPTKEEALAVSPTYPAACAQDKLEPI